jgi:hypothetical protein
MYSIAPHAVIGAIQKLELFHRLALARSRDSRHPSNAAGMMNDLRVGVLDGVRGLAYVTFVRRSPRMRKVIQMLVDAADTRVIAFDRGAATRVEASNATAAF